MPSQGVEDACGGQLSAWPVRLGKRLGPLRRLLQNTEVLPELTLRLANSFAALTDTADQIAQFLEDHAVPGDAVFAANLAVEELVTNIIKYGYDDDDAHDILLRLTLPPGELVIEIEDDGHEFNPFEQPEPDTTLAAEERPIGGLGIHFVRNLLDTWTYERKDGRNIVRLTKRLAAADDSER
jgi:anti-sigma regulatory factor (Ser/Thr protein kinase)